MKQPTFKELYKMETSKPTPGKQFVTTIMQLTKTSEITVRMWLSGTRTPNALCQQTIAKHFHTTPQALFPPQ